MTAARKPDIDPATEAAYLRWLAEDAMTSAPGRTSWHLAVYGWLTARADRLTNSLKQKGN